MARTKKYRRRERDHASDGGSATGRYIPNGDNSVAMSEVTHEEDHSISRSKYHHRGKKNDDQSAVSSASKSSRGSGIFSRLGFGSSSSSPPKKSKKKHRKKPRDSSQPPADSPSVRSRGSVGTAGTASNTTPGSNDTKKMTKDSKARFNIGLVYLKTGDYAKAQENLEHSMYCYIQLNGHDTKQYSNDVLGKIAGVREKLGDCYLANPSGDKAFAMDHYEEARRMLRTIDKEDAPEDVIEMMDRIDEKIKDPALKRSLSNTGSAPATLPPAPSSGYEKAKAKYEKKLPRSDGTSFNKTNKGREVAFAAGAGTVIGAGTAAVASKSVGEEHSIEDDFTPAGIVRRAKRTTAMGLGNLIEGIGDVMSPIGDVFTAARGDLAKSVADGLISQNDVDQFEVAMEHLERNNHRTALNHLSQLQNGGGMNDPAFRQLLEVYMMRVAETAMKDDKIGVATDAFEEAFALLRQEDDPGRNLKIVTRGCIKGHKMLAVEEERDEDWEAVIEHRNRVHQLLDMENKVIPTCEQLMIVAYCYGQLNNYEQSLDTLSDAMKRLTKGVRSMEVMPKNRIPPLIRCCQMRAVGYSKLGKWQEAHDQYDEILPLIAREEGILTKPYNNAMIQKGALLVSLGKYKEASNTFTKYNAMLEQQRGMTSLEEIVEDNDHLLALDTFAAAHIKLGNYDGAIECFRKKLDKLNTMPKTDEMKGQTMHNLGCLLAYKQNFQDALPLLSKALDTRKFMYGGNNKFLMESSWSVAATSQALGDSSKAMKEYGKLIEKMKKSDDVPINSITVLTSAGKLYYDNNKFDLAMKAFNDALKKVNSSGGDNAELKSNILLNLANVQTAHGDTDKAIRSYNEIINTPKLNGSVQYYTALFDKSLLLHEKMGDKDEAFSILKELTSRRSKSPMDIKGNAYIALGQLIISDGNPQDRIDDALKCYNKAIDIFNSKADLQPMTVAAKKNIAMAHYKVEEYDTAIDELQDILEDLSRPEMSEKRDAALADIWSCLSQVYLKKGDISSAKNFAKLALQCYKSKLGEKHPTSLRQSSNLAVILLQEAESLPKGQEDQAKTIIDAAKFEMEAAMEAFVSLDDLWTFRLDVASLKTNLGLIAVWQQKPKKAQKLLRQVKEIEIPEGHPLESRIAHLEKSVEQIGKKK